MLRGLIASVAALSLATTPALAQSSASKLSVASSVRAGATTEGEKLGGGNTLLIVAAVAAAVALAVFVVFDDDDSDSN
jgi:hypothetical protein